MIPYNLLRMHHPNSWEYFPEKQNEMLIIIKHKFSITIEQMEMYYEWIMNRFIPSFSII